MNLIRMICRRLSVSAVKQNAVNSIGPEPAKELQFTVPWGHIAAKQWGDAGGKPVLGVHGWQDNAGTFDTLAPLLPSNWNFVAIDLPGHGLSSHYVPGYGYYVEDYVISVQRVINQLKWDKFNYIGHSMGAGLGMIYASLFPEKIDHLVSIDLIRSSELRAADPRWKERLIKSVEKRVQFESDGKPPPVYEEQEAIQKVVENMLSSTTPDSSKILMKRGAKFLPDKRIQFTRDRRLLIPGSMLLCVEQNQTLVQNMTCNFLALVASNGIVHDSQTNAEFIKLYEEHCKKFKMVKVDGTHHVHLNDPQTVVKDIVDFIQ